MVNAVIPLPEDYHVEFNFQFLKRSPKELLHVVEGDTVFKLFIIDNTKYLARIVAGNGVFTVTFPALQPDEAALAAISSYIKEWFDLASDLQPFYKIASGDRLLAPLVKHFYGYRIVGQPDLFESLVWAVIGQQINLQFAYTLKQRFVAQYGTTLHWNDRTYYAFPDPKIVVNLRDEDLLPLQFSRQKSKYVQLIAEAFVDGRVSKSQLGVLPFEAAKEHLTKIKGVGNWTANYALMKTFRYPDAFPLEDAGIHNAIKNLKKMKQKPTLAQVKRIFKKYKGWEAYATLYLWKSLELRQ